MSETVTPAQGDPGNTPESPEAGGESRTAPGEPDYKRLYLDIKGEREERNQLRDAVKQLREQIGSSPATREDPAAETKAGAWKATEEWAERKDPASIAVLELRRDIAARDQAYVYAEQIKEMPKDDQASVYKRFMEGSGRYTDPNAVYAEIERDRLRVKTRELEDKLAALNSTTTTAETTTTTEHGRKPVNTAIRDEPGSSPTETKKMLTADFDRRHAKFVRDGNLEGARDLERQLRSGRIDLDD